MYLSIIILPLLSSLVSGFLGRKIGVTGSQIITCSSLIITSILITIAFYEVGICGSPVSIDILNWVDIEILNITWSFYFDQLTVSLGLAVIYCSTLIHIYSVDYLSTDPHIQRFFAYLSAFTAGMLVLICGGNFLVMFVGWESIGVASYLLINFYFTRIQSNKAAILAFTMNRGGDMLMSIGFFAIFSIFGSFNYSEIFSLIPFINESTITIISLLLLGGALAKSANIPLHSWLPGSMEALNVVKQLYIFFIFLFLFFYNYNNSYDINYLSVFPIINSIPKSLLYAITGNMLGDGSISLSRPLKGLGKFSMTMDVYSLNYLHHLDNNIYSQFTETKIYPYPNILLPHHKDKKITQYHFKTKTHPLYTALHSLWYKKNNEGNKFIKIVPLNISEIFSDLSLAYWIMDDGYFDSYGRAKTVILCTDSFIEEECIILQSLLEKLDIKSTLKIRNKNKNSYRIRISKTSMDIVIALVKPHIHNDFLYKLGL